MCLVIRSPADRAAPVLRTAPPIMNMAPARITLESVKPKKMSPMLMTLLKNKSTLIRITVAVKLIHFVKNSRTASTRTLRSKYCCSVIFLHSLSHECLRTLGVFRCIVSFAEQQEIMFGTDAVLFAVAAERF